MELRIYTGENDLATGCYGIKEPTGKVFTDFAKIDVAIIPGVAFDRQGHRLGRGKGYYDRLLSVMPQVYKIGLCFDFQVVDNVPVDSHDIRMDEVIIFQIEDNALAATYPIVHAACRLKPPVTASMSVTSPAK